MFKQRFFANFNGIFKFCSQKSQSFTLKNQFYTVDIYHEGSGFDFKVYLKDQKKNISFWHDLDLHLKDGVFNAVIEIPRYHLEKYEMSKEIEGNPIIQDTRKSRYTGKKELRYYAMFPYFNYGFFPKTWESPYFEEEKFFGDDDPLDAIEVGRKTFKLGEQIPVRVLGAYCLLDQNEVDWKIICLNEQEAQEKNIKTVEDLEKKEPGIQLIIKNWLKYIKVYDGKKENSLLYNESAHDPGKAIEVIEKTHLLWQELVGRRKSSGPDYNEKRKDFNIVV